MKRALITGANSLVNQSLLNKLVDMKFDVTAHYHSNNQITKDLKEKYPGIRFIQADFTDKNTFLKFVDQSMDGKYDVLINGAVYYGESNSWKAQQDWDEWQKTFAVNTASAGILMAHADTVLNNSGVVINISSTFGQQYMGDMQFTMYSASKAALDSLTMTYAKRWSPNIRVVSIAPGWVRSSWNKNMSEEEIKWMIGPQLTHRLIEPDEIANLMQTIITNKGINGTTLVIDGGLGSPKIGKPAH